MSILQNSNAISAGGYDINNSLRFRSSASARLSRTPSVAGTTTKWTFSGWVKRSNLGARGGIFGAVDTYIQFVASDVLEINLRAAATNYIWTTSQVFRDPSAWYHIVLAVDTTQATATNRMLLYVNGVQVTSFASSATIPQNTATAVNNTVLHTLGSYNATTDYLDGYQAECYLIDGQALTPSSFGETDAVTGSWVAKKYTGTYGTNGFYLPFKTTSTTSASFSSYYGTFDNSAKYLSLAGNTAFAFGTGDFCVEAFVTFNSPSTTEQCIITMATSAAGDTAWDFNVINGTLYFGGWTTVISGAFNVPSGFCHLVACRASGVLSIYANGIRIATGSHTLNYTNTSNTLTIGRRVAASALNGRISNLRIVKGSSVYTPSSSTLTVPTSALTAISGTSLLTLQNATIVDNSTNAFTITNNGTVATTSGSISSSYITIGNDYSGNTNGWTLNNINYTTSGTTYDAMTDSPTNTSATVANYPTLNPLVRMTTGVGVSVSPTISNGNLTAVPTANNNGTLASFGVTSGKWYFEVNVVTGTTLNNVIIGITYTPSTSLLSGGGVGYEAGGNKIINGTSTSYGSSTTTGDVIGVALDADASTVTFYKNNTSQGSISYTNSGTEIYPSYFSGGGTSANHAFNFGQRPFTYTPPTGYKALNTYNLPDSTIKKGNKYMDATLFTGTGSAQNIINNGGFKPDLVWEKPRSAVGNNTLVDSVRGATIELYSNTTGSENTVANDITGFLSNGFSVGAGYAANTHVAWQWQAGQGTTSSGTGTGGITSVTQSVNTTAGFSIVTYTGSGANGTVTHGLGVAPKMVIVKNRSAAQEWLVYHSNMSATPATVYMPLNSTAAASSTTTAWNSTAPTSSVFSVGTAASANGSGNSMVAYCWAEIAGFSKFGSYTGNGSNDGVFVYTGFRPKYLMVKRTTGSVYAWCVWDSARETYNVENAIITVNTSNAENTGTLYADFLSNGFKFRSFSNGSENASGEPYVYAAFAESPFKYANAR